MECETSEEMHCPICPFSTTSIVTLEFHTESHFRVQTDSPITQRSVRKAFDDVCPVCYQDGFCSVEDLENHVDSHFSDDVTPNDACTGAPIDKRTAENLDSNSSKILPDVVCLADVSGSDMEGTDVMKDLERRREETEFKKLRAIYGFDPSRNMSQQRDASLASSVRHGKMSAAEYHEKRIMLRMAEKTGGDDGSSCTRGIIPDLERHCRSSTGVRAMWFCSPMDHYASSIGDTNWGCGYRNLQMLLSCLLRNPLYVDRLQRFSPVQTADHVQVPSITRLQSAIEEAWEQGFDLQGCEQLGGKLADTAKWIGASEVATLLASCSIRYRLIDFHRPSSSDGKYHCELIDWVVHYFKNQAVFKPPLFLQHQGHSRTIVGIEETKNFQVRLLVIDPSHKPAQMFRLREGEHESAEPPPVLKKIRLTLYSLKSKQYQIVCIDKGFIDDPQEFSASKVLRSTRIP